MPETLETPAATAVDSATTEQQPASLPELSTLTPAERQTWRTTGELPKKQDSAPAKKDAATSDSATEKDKKTSADTASESATDKDQKPHLKTKEDTDRRFREILDENKALQRRLESLERGKGTDPRDTKQESQPATETYKPLDEKEFFKANPKGTYEDFVRAAAKHEAKWEVRQEMAAERVRQANEAAARDLSTRVEDAKKRYPDFEARVKPAVASMMDDPQIPHAVKAIINDSPVFEHLLYTITDPANFADLIKTAKSNPAAAIRKIVLTEQLVQAELAKSNTAGEGKDKAGDDARGRDASGKFVASDSKKDAASEPISRAPKPPSEVGGRTTAPTDDVASALKSAPGKLTGSAKEALNRQYAERHK